MRGSSAMLRRSFTARYPENGSYKLIARVQMEEWPQIVAAAK